MNCSAIKEEEEELASLQVKTGYHVSCMFSAVVVLLISGYLLNIWSDVVFAIPFVDL